MRKAILALALAAVPLSGVQAMNVAEFLQKADRLEKKGMAAMLSSDYRLMQREVEAGFRSVRAERLAAERSGRRGAYCPPARPKLTTKEILDHFRAVAPAERAGMSVRDGLKSLLVRKFPCRA